MQTGVLISLAAYFVLMLAIGLFAWKKSTDTSEGYLLAGRGLSLHSTRSREHDRL